MMEVIRMPTIPNVEIPYPDLGMKDQFAKQPGMRYGSLSIENDRIRVDDGTSTTVQIDSAGFHGYNHASQELVRVNYLGFHGYTTAGVELVTVDGSGLRGLMLLAMRLLKLTLLVFMLQQQQGRNN